MNSADRVIHVRSDFQIHLAIFVTWKAGAADILKSEFINN